HLGPGLARATGRARLTAARQPAGLRHGDDRAARSRRRRRRGGRGERVDRVRLPGDHLRGTGRALLRLPPARSPPRTGQRDPPGPDAGRRDPPAADRLTPPAPWRRPGRSPMMTVVPKTTTRRDPGPGSPPTGNGEIPTRLLVLGMAHADGTVLAEELYPVAAACGLTDDQ